MDEAAFLTSLFAAALAAADPARLGADAGVWGRYYDTGPVVVAGKIRTALERAALHE